MSSLEASLENFLDALGTLERALDRRFAAEAEGTDGDALAEELDGLRSDNVSLTTELERLRTQNRALEALTDDVNVRLDGAIGEIRNVLE